MKINLRENNNKDDEIFEEEFEMKVEKKAPRDNVKKAPPKEANQVDNNILLKGLNKWYLNEQVYIYLYVYLCLCLSFEINR